MSDQQSAYWLLKRSSAALCEQREQVLGLAHTHTQLEDGCQLQSHSQTLRLIPSPKAHSQLPGAHSQTLVVNACSNCGNTVLRQ